MPKVRRRRLANLLGALRFALLAAAMIPASLAAHAQAFTLPPPEKVPTFLGIDLPLRPGERLLPLGNSGCSMVVFAPKPAHYEAQSRQYKQWEWSGACRFGLIHGNGDFSLPDVSGSAYEISAIYGTPFFPTRYQHATSAYHWAYSGTAFSELSTKRMNFSGSGDLENLDRFEKTSGNVFGIFLDAFDTAGTARTVSISSAEVSYVCANDNEDIYKPFAKEVKKVCSRNQAGQFVVYRREGSAVLSYENPIVWLKACPLNKGTRQADCPALMRDAIGKHDAELETILAGSPAARPVMIQEILNRYAPLEAAVEARLKEMVTAGGAR